jgi:lipopolysaccharide/colanic/teichoic acid biosynthesis glycosyltransferase
MQDAEQALSTPALSSSQPFSWVGVQMSGGGVVEGDGVAVMTLDTLGAPAARVLARGRLYAEQSERTRGFYVFCKRAIDIVLASVLLLLALPLLIAVAVLVKISGRGPILFRHRRVGLGGKEFDCLKFRTMVVDADDQLKNNEFLQRQFQQSFKLRDDPRVTRVGAFLRKSSLDELPQLLQVLRGEMSLVGPRPVVRPELEKYSIYADKLLTVKPGLSGLWQVCGRSDTTYPQRVMMDMHYIDHRSLSLDLRLMLHTVGAVVRKSGAC